MLQEGLAWRRLSTREKQGCLWGLSTQSRPLWDWEIKNWSRDPPRTFIVYKAPVQRDVWGGAVSAHVRVDVVGVVAIAKEQLMLSLLASRSLSNLSFMRSTHTRTLILYGPSLRTCCNLCFSQMSEYSWETNQRADGQRDFSDLHKN